MSARTRTLSVVLSVVFVLIPALSELAHASKLEFIWVGRLDSQFTATQYQIIAKGYPIAVLAKFHAGWDLTKHEAAARRLKQLNPEIQVFPYYSASYWFSSNTYGQDEFKQEWYLHDVNGSRIPKAKNGFIMYYVDMSNAEYRSWALGIIQGWLDKQLANGKPVYDGIAFDSANIYNVYEKRGLRDRNVSSLIYLLGGSGSRELGIRRLKAWNEGMKQFLLEARNQLVLPNGEKAKIIFNGVGDLPWRYNQNLQLTKNADMMLNEDFSFDNQTILNKERIVRDINLMLDPTYASKIFLEKANIIQTDGVTADERRHFQRFSYGSFLLGCRPGFTFYKYGESLDRLHTVYTTSGELQDLSGHNVNPPEIRLHFGNPLSGRYQKVGLVYKRPFERGRVYVNMEDTPQSVSIPKQLILMDGDTPSKTLQPGAILTIGAKDAAFLLDKLPGGGTP